MFLTNDLKIIDYREPNNFWDSRIGADYVNAMNLTVIFKTSLINDHNYHKRFRSSKGYSFRIPLFYRLLQMALIILL